MGRAVPVPPGEDARRSASTPRWALPLLRVPAVGRRHHASCATIEHVDFVEAVRRLADRPASPSPRIPRPPPSASGGPRSTTPWRRPSTSTTSGSCRPPTPGPARDYLRSRGYDGDVVRTFRLGWAPDDWDALAKHLQGVCRTVLDRVGSRLREPPRPPAGRLPGPGHLPHLRPLGQAHRPRGPHPARPGRRRRDGGGPGRAQVQELPGRPHLRQAPHPVRPQLGQARRDRERRGDRVRGVHRRHRLLPGRAAAGRGHLRHGAGRGALPAAAQLRPPGRPRLRRRRRRRGRGRRASTNGSATTRSTWPWPPCRPGADPADLARDRSRARCGAPSPTPSRSSPSGSTGSWRRPTCASPKAGPRRPRRPWRWWPSTPTSSCATST